ETAKVMINAGHPGATVLLFNEVWWNVRTQKVLTLDSKTTTIEIPITKADVPNFFLTAVTVRNGRIIQESREICVPPAEEFLMVNVTPDKPSYKPGETMNLAISAQDKAGKPVAAEFDLSVFDKSILYIQPEYGSEIRTWFHGQRRQHWNNLMSSQGNMGWPQQWFEPNRQYYGVSYPPAWMGDWGTAGEFGQGGLMMEEEKAEGLADAEVGPATGPGQAGGGRFGFHGGGMRGMPKAAMAMDAAGGAMPPMAPGAPTAANAMRAEADGSPAGAAVGEEAPAFAAATVRSNFADAAFWQPAVVTDKDGRATVKVPMPENLTGWVINSHFMSNTCQVSASHVEVVTAKNLLVRLQTPRFAVQTDRVVISANVMNYLAKDKQAKVSLEINGKCAQIEGDATRTVTVSAAGEARVDWTVVVTKPGKIEMVCTALTDEESDAMKVDFPAVVYGLPVMLTQTKTMPYGEGTQNINMAIALPEKFDPEQSTLEVSYTPTLAGGMLEAMPYLVGYPYGCTEQTMSRYLPTVMVSDTLEKTGVDLASVRKAGKRPAPEAVGRYGPYYYPYYYENPVFDKSEVNKMVEAGLDRLYSFQHGDGGWGWWKDDHSSPYMTAYVCYGLQIGRNAKQPVDQGVLARGYGYLNNLVNEIDFSAKLDGYDYQVRGPEGLAFMAVALAQGGQANDKLAQYLIANQDKMSDYGKALSVCALAHWNKKVEARKVFDGLLKHVEVNKEFETAALAEKHPEGYCYWYWYNNNIEANAWTLRALMAVQPDSDLGPKMVRWLLAQRRGYRWNSTRDTAMCLYAMTDYLEKSKEAQCDYELTIDHEGVKKTVAISAANMFNFDCRYVLKGEDVLGGKPDAAGRKSVGVDMSRKGKGAVYATMALEVYSQDEHIPAGGNQMSIARKYYKLTPKTVMKKTRNAQGEAIDMPVLEYDRTELKAGDGVKSGDRIEVELTLNTPFEYEYMAIEDWKPAGCEPVDLTSDAQEGVDAWWTHRELRDQKVTFFVTWLNRGKATLTYQLRAEIPGVFHVLPTKAYLMYTPEIQANSESFTMPIQDTPVVK
ncbi:MAG TPA: alpha-2-macroglobulin family protein, partial [Planctomycetota bacterium]|nr:alpha-2-macroglobulin family protein [Planctomycetota bacterium]